MYMYIVLIMISSPSLAPLSTVGVDVGMWKYRKDLEPSYRAKKGSKQLRSVTFYTWDFGGQVCVHIHVHERNNSIYMYMYKQYNHMSRIGRKKLSKTTCTCIIIHYIMHMCIFLLQIYYYFYYVAHHNVYVYVHVHIQHVHVRALAHYFNPFHYRRSTMPLINAFSLSVLSTLSSSG